MCCDAFYRCSIDNDGDGVINLIDNQKATII